MTGKSNAFSYQHSSQHIIIATVISALDSILHLCCWPALNIAINYKVKMWQYNNCFLLYMLIVKAQQMERFLIALVLSNGSIWERAHRKWNRRQNLEDDSANYPSIRSKQTKICYCVSLATHHPLVLAAIHLGVYTEHLLKPVWTHRKAKQCCLPSFNVILLMWKMLSSMPLQQHLY